MVEAPGYICDKVVNIFGIDWVRSNLKRAFYRINCDEVNAKNSINLALELAGKRAINYIVQKWWKRRDFFLIKWRYFRYRLHLMESKNCNA
jgi:hypothetical protein